MQSTISLQFSKWYPLPKLVKEGSFDAQPTIITEKWPKLEVLNMCRNKLTSLPSQICKLESLRRLMVNENQLDFEGIPSGIGKIVGLEVFSAAHNRLEMIPEGLCRYTSDCLLNFIESDEGHSRMVV